MRTSQCQLTSPELANCPLNVLLTSREFAYGKFRTHTSFCFYSPHGCVGQEKNALIPAGIFPRNSRTTLIRLRHSSFPLSSARYILQTQTSGDDRLFTRYLSWNDSFFPLPEIGPVASNVIKTNVLMAQIKQITGYVISELVRNLDETRHLGNKVER